MERSFARRRFLQGVAAVALASSRPWLASTAAELPVPKFGLGFSLYGMRTLKVPEALRVCKRIGYSGVELVANPGWPCEPSTLGTIDRRDLRSQLQDLGLALPSLMEDLHLLVDEATQIRNLERIKQAAELGHALAPASPPVIETILGGKPADWEQVKEKMAESLKSWAEAAQTANIVIAVKAHVGGALHTPEGAHWLVAQVASPWIKLVYDYSHFELGVFSRAESLALLLPETAMIHVKDSRPAADGKPFAFLLPGEGKTDYEQYFQQLKAADYRGFVVVEVSGQIHGRAGYDPLATATRAYELLAPAYRKVS